jgi:hypothetical protein
MPVMNSVKFNLQIFADVFERLLDVQRSMVSGQAWFNKGLTNVSFRPAGDKEENWEAFLAKRATDRPQDCLLNIFPIAFVETIDNNGHWAGNAGFPTWIQDQLLELGGE